MLPAMFSAAANKTKVFDTVTSFKQAARSSLLPKVSGIEKDSGANISVEFTFDRSYDASFAMGCLPLILTAMEKPGRYYLHVTWDVQLQNCMLSLKAQPE